MGLADVFVLDPGSDTIRAGRAEDFPQDERSPYVAVPANIFDGAGRVASWDAYEAVLDYVFYNALGWPEGDEGFVTLTENPLRASRRDRETLAQLLFEVFNVRGMHVLDSCVASVYAAGKVSGVCVDLGHSGTTVAQVVEGATVPGAGEHLAQGGAAIEALLESTCAARGLTLTARQLRELKQAAARVEPRAVAASGTNVVDDAATNSEAAERDEEVGVQLPDGQVINLGKEDRRVRAVSTDAAQAAMPGGDDWARCKLGAVLVEGYGGAHSANSSPVALAADERPRSLAAAIFACAMHGDIDNRKELLSNVFLCGGCARVPGVSTRVQQDLVPLLQRNSTIACELIQVPAYMPSRSTHFSSYVGACIVSKDMPVTHMFTKEDYDAYGPTFLHNKCRA